MYTSHEAKLYYIKRVKTYRPRPSSMSFLPSIHKLLGGLSFRFWPSKLNLLLTRQDLLFFSGHLLITVKKLYVTRVEIVALYPVLRSLSIFPLKQSPNVEVTNWTLIINKLHWVCKATFSGFILEIKWAPFCNFMGPFFKKGAPRKGVPQ